MRILAILIAGLVLVQPARAVADRAGELVASGEALAKAGRLTDAIDAFKQADRIRPRASHACLIALAYFRRELWPQAEVYLDACRVRSGATDPLPEWFALAHQQLVERLATADVAAVEIRVEPADLAATASIGMSSFLPDERFAPQVVHLSPGTHVITATVEGHPAAQQTIEVKGRSKLTVVFDFAAAGGVAVRVPVPAAQTPRRSRVPMVVTAIGGAVLVAGAGFHLFAFKPVHDRLIDATDETPDPALYDANESSFETRRAVTIALYGLGAAAVITGLALRAGGYGDEPDRPRITVGATDGGAMVGVEWSR